MTVEQQEFINNYNSLITKVNPPRISTIIPFCIYLQSDDEHLYKEFESIYDGMRFGNIRTNDFINYNSSFTPKRFIYN